MGKTFLPWLFKGWKLFDSMMPALGQKVQEWMPKVQNGWEGCPEVKTTGPPSKETVVTIADALQRVGE